MAEAKKKAPTQTSTKEVLAGKVNKVTKASSKLGLKETKDGHSKEDHKTKVQADSKKEVASKKVTKPAIVDADQLLDSSEPLITPAPAKAGRRSAKAIAEAEEKQAKVERLAKSAEAESEGGKSEKSKAVKSAGQRTARAKIERRSKNYRKSAELIDKTKQYGLAEALELVKKTSTVKFDASVELHVRLNVDPKQADQNIRDNVTLPAGTGKTIRIAVFADPDNVAKAKKAGADIAASDEFLQQLDKEEVNFDVLISTPAMMAKLGKYARLLGPKGLMPNPKSGTVTNDVAKAVTEAKAGKVEYRVDSTGIVHVAFGKVSFDTNKLLQNAEALLASIKAAKPSGIKGNYVKSTYLTTTMGPSIRLVSL